MKYCACRCGDARGGRAQGSPAYWDDFLAGTDVFYGHVLGFKGLERTAVVLAVNGFREPERARRMLYTGLSRARVLLVVVGPRAEIERPGDHSAASCRRWRTASPPRRSISARGR